MNLVRLPTFKKAGVIVCVVECPRGSQTKYKYDPENKVFELVRALPIGLTYPFDWGFIPSTLGEDGDPLDVMLIHDCATFPGLVIACQVIGVLEILQQDGGGKAVRNDRIFAVPVKAGREDGIQDISDLSKRLRKELERFFLWAAQLEDKKLEILDWKGAHVAERLVEQGHRLFKGKGE